MITDPILKSSRQLLMAFFLDVAQSAEPGQAQEAAGSSLSSLKAEVPVFLAIRVDDWQTHTVFRQSFQDSRAFELREYPAHRIALHTAALKWLRRRFSMVRRFICFRISRMC